MADPSVDLFGAVAAAYAQHRPTYPAAWFGRFAARCGHRRRVWDCGCGNGQASLALAEVFDEVVATDASPNQIEEAIAHPRIRYSCAPASASGLPAGSVDAVLVAQAVHWFAGEAFNAEVLRVARPGAVLAWIGYLTPQLPDPELQERFDRFYGDTLQPWWAPERDWVDRRYAGLPFPGQEWPFPDDLQIERHWSLEAFLNYLATWSAVESAQRHGEHVLAGLEQELISQWPEQGQRPLLIRWPLMGRWGPIHPET
ncbi:MAG: hypothetical protein RLZZ611_115 [Cyanobacteriota bacterium]|jgi:SAM-dependent methyltransferase